MSATEIVTAELKHGHGDVRRIAARYPSSRGARTLPGAGVALAGAVAARVNDGRWIADCPSLVCGGAEYVSFESPVFFCCECRNAEAGCLPLPVSVPTARERARIEEVLLARPEVKTRQWWPGETVAMLEAENRAHRGER